MPKFSEVKPTVVFYTPFIPAPIGGFGGIVLDLITDFSDYGYTRINYGSSSTVPSPLISATSAANYHSPLPTATDTRGQVKKQMRSTSHKYSRRNNYYNKRKRYNRY